MLMGMTQLILDMDGDNLVLPEVRKERYYACRVSLDEAVVMISGRMTKELGGDVWQIGYEYGYFPTDMKKRVIAACEKGKRTPITCAFLPPDSDGALIRSQFWVTAFSYPKFFWSRREPDGRRVPLWGDFSLTLREVEPSD